jgi:hypothetical protein
MEVRCFKHLCKPWSLLGLASSYPKTPNTLVQTRTYNVVVSTSAPVYIYAVCTFSEVSGIFQLFTSHHHLLIFAPTDCPFNVEDLFICLHPETISVHAIPCTKGIKICNPLELHSQ